MVRSIRRALGEVLKRRKRESRSGLARGLEVCEERTLLTVNLPLYGLNFTPFINADENPTTGIPGQLTNAEIQERIAAIADKTQWIKLSSSDPDLLRVTPYARAAGLKIVATAQLDGSSNDQTQIDLALELAKKGFADMLLIGSQTILNGFLTPEQLIDDINGARASLRSAGVDIPVTTSEDWSILAANRALTDACDVVLGTFYPFRNGVAIEKATQTLHDEVLQLSAAAGRKAGIGETGWPSAGKSVRNADANPENAAIYFQNVVSMTRAEDIPLFYFASFDEPWRESVTRKEFDPHWGIETTSLTLKPGFDTAFQGESLPYDWALPTGNVPNLDGPWVTSSGRFVQVMQDRRDLGFVNAAGEVSPGIFVDRTTVQASGWNVTGVIDTTTADNGRILWSNGTVWTRLNADGSYRGSSGNLTSVSQVGLGLTFTNAAGGTSTGVFLDANTVAADAWHITGTFTKDGTILWSNGTAWTRLSLSENYRNATNNLVHVTQDDATHLTFTNRSRQTSAGIWLSPTVVQAIDWNVTGTVTDGQILWSNGTVWNKDLLVVGTLNGQEVGIHASNDDVTLVVGGSQVPARITAPNTLVMINSGVSGTRTNGRILWSDGTVWDNFDFNALDAIFADVDTFPFPV